jgi:glutathione synthase/RimK-type ligase-like ATP-grasp enzyme
MFMKQILMLTDYKSHFGSKYTANPYKSGMDKELLRQYFDRKGYNISYIPFTEVNLKSMKFDKQYVLYTSSEDDENFYKSYIEDICYALLLQGAVLIPEYRYLRAHGNKVFMELLRDLCDLDDTKTIESRHFGCLEEMLSRIDQFTFPVVIKGAGGSQSKFVSLSEETKKLVSQAKKISRTKKLTREMWELGRSCKHQGYIRESKYRKKFVVQNYVENLPNDWKILIFGKKYYVLFRKNRENDFRASGSGKFRFPTDAPRVILDYAEKIFDVLKIPHLSLDIGYDGKKLYLIEFQALYFGTTALEKSPFYYERKNKNWVTREEKSILEKEYVEGVDVYIKKYL